MSRENDETIAVYETDVERYVKRYFLPQNDANHKMVSDLIKRSIENFPKNINVFEVGAGPGLYAKYIESIGYHIEVTDVADGFVEYMKSQGQNASKFNLINDEFTKKYDYILAIAVLLHFTKSEVLGSIRKIYDALNQGGVFVFSIKTGEGEEFVDNDFGKKRFFNFYQPDEILDIVKNAGFSVVETLRDNDVEPGRAHFYVVAKKEDK